MEKNKMNIQEEQAILIKPETPRDDVETISNVNVWDIKVIPSFILSALFLFVGAYKLYAYSNSDLGEPVNAYVEGDAYNFIINAGQSTAYFVLALIFVVLGCTFLICNQLKESFKK
ncbi:hypothetical protein J9317_16640 [Metabacillus sp. KIGAM252]|uniref:Uncharacterized protein n=1 Tax=Metabacillus flavus TaxID=2823519 RepID=A0ABS5LI05_9BACI|nr:hypothetical protein [Metabacillus flavus]MBS2970376.1 hypothetical protein [Metabacillus flavus]